MTFALSSVHLRVLSSRAQHETSPGTSWPRFGKDIKKPFYTLLHGDFTDALMFASVSVSPPELQPVFSSLESSPQPEKISLEDLTGILSGTLN